MNIWIIRHGESEGNKQKIFSRSLPLTLKGVGQAEWIRDFLADKKIRQIYSSSLRRARETANIIGKSLGIEPVGVDDLREIEYGDLEGKHYSIAEEFYPEVFSIDPEQIMSISYPGGETHLDVYNRVLDWLNKTKRGWKANEDVAIVTHALIAKIMITILLGCPPKFFIKFKIGNGSTSRLQVLGEVGYLVDFNRIPS